MLPRIGCYPRWCGVLALAAASALAEPPPIFDAHLHYNAEAVVAYPVPAVLEIVRRYGVRAILATSVPNDGTRALLAASSAEVRVVPFLRPYRSDADRGTWFRDARTLSLIDAELARADYRGIGEFHVFGDDARSDVVGRIVDLAASRGLYLHAHCDEAALEGIFGRNANVRVIWAHTGFNTPPERIERWFERHPTLWGELSYRYDMTREGMLTPDWRALLLRHGDRFVIGSDTWTNDRWQRYGEIIDWYRGWLSQLPVEIAQAIAWKNADRLFPR
jgi:amidohydrolase family protein